MSEMPKAGPTPLIQLEIDEVEEFCRTTLADLARGGVRVPASPVLPVDSEVQVLLTPPGQRPPLSLRGRVVEIIIDQSSGESLPVGMEIKFVDLRRDEEISLAALLAEYDRVAESDEPRADASLDQSACEEQSGRLQTRLVTLRGRVTQLQAEIDDLAQEDRASRAVIERLEAQRARLSAAQQNAAHLRDDVATLEAQHAELSERLRQLADQTLRQATEAAEQAYVLQHRQADAVEHQADTLAEGFERNLSERRQRLAEANAMLSALREQAEAATRTTQEEVEAVRDRLRAAKRIQAELRSTAAAISAEEQRERDQRTAQLGTATKQLHARRAANAELVEELDRAAARHERLASKRRDLERLLGLLPRDGASDAQPPMASDTEQDLLTGVDVDIEDPSEPMV